MEIKGPKRVFLKFKEVCPNPKVLKTQGKSLGNYRNPKRGTKEFVKKKWFEIKPFLRAQKARKLGKSNALEIEGQLPE